MKKKASINASDVAGKTALFYACDRGKYSTIKWLLLRQADATLQSKDGTTPLMIAAKKGDIGMGSMLVRRKADVNAADVQGNTVLLTALRNRSSDFAKWLINTEETDRLVPNNDGQTPIECANENSLRTSP